MRWLVTILGRTLAWRIGRALYMAARGEGVNDMASNGEALVIGRVASHLAGRGDNQAIVVDCGANLGDWTASAIDQFARHAVTPALHLMEPSPASATALARRFDDRPDVTIHAVALSDRDGTATFHLVSPTGGTNSLVPDGTPDAATVEVRTARGAGYFAQLGISRIDLLKIDTEGHDFAVLSGFDDMLAAQAIAVVQFEYNFRWLASGRALHNVFDLAKRHGYRVGRANGTAIELYQSWNAENDRFFEWNYLLIRPDMARALDAREMQWGPSNTLIPA